MAKVNTNLEGYPLQETGYDVERILQSVKDKANNSTITALSNEVAKKADKSELPTIDSNLSTTSGNPIANKAVANAIDGIKNGITEISPNLGSGTQYLGDDISSGLDFIHLIAYQNSVNGYPPTYAVPTHYLDGDEIFVTPSDYSGFASLAAIAAAVYGNKTDINTLNGNDAVDGSIEKKVKDAINAFATTLTDDGTVNTYKEVLDWISTHGADFAELVGRVNTNANNIADLRLNGISISTAEKAQLIAEIKQAVIADLGANVAHYEDIEEEQ